MIDAHKHVWAKADMPDPNACWLWRAQKSSNGYGVIGRNDRIDGKTVKRTELAHRIAYQLAYGPIRPTDLICHRCDVRHCINPTHLFAGTHKDNTLDMMAKQRNAYGERQPTAKINNATALAIIAFQGTHKEAAAAFNITYHHAYYVRTRRHWKHLDLEAA